MHTINPADKRIQAIVIASWISIIGNALLATAKLTAGLISGSFAVVGDGIDSATDVLISFVTLAAAKIIAQPPDKNHPYGHGRAEAIATKVLSFIIFFAGVQLILSAVHRVTSNEPLVIPTALALYVTATSIVGKLMLSWYQFRIGKRHASSMLTANAKNMRNDILISISVLLGVIMTRATGTPYIDLTVAIALGLWIMKSAIGIFMETKTELMDGMDDTSVYNAIFEAVSKIPGISNPHRVRVRKIAQSLIVDIDIEVDGAMTVLHAHEIAKKVEMNIKETIPEVYDVIVHIEPKGNVEPNERFGLSEKNIHDDE